ncbi:YraN family protein [candidate division KSB1 bacterium]|nr:YraN family protein [candidate division KSB1 bacterium]
MPSETQRQNLAIRGENLATQYLRQRNYSILARNFRRAGGEIDIIAQYQQILIFVEVKTSHWGNTYGAPETWVTPRKQQRLAHTAQHYLQVNAIEDMDCRFDVIGITYAFGTWYIHHLENAFSLPD